MRALLPTLLAVLLCSPARGTAVRDAEEVLLRGMVTVKDRAGTLHTDGSGRIHVETTSLDGEVETGWREFRDGRWEMNVRADALLSIGYAESGPDPVLVVEPSEWELSVPASRSIDVLVAAQQRVFLRVYDARTGEDLGGVTVMQCQGDSCAGSYDSKHPFPNSGPSEDTIAREAESPVRLPACDEFGSRTTYWVRAPGYAWRVLDCDLTRGGVLSVPLEREARLRWEIEGTGGRGWSLFAMRDVRSTSTRWPHPVSYTWSRLRPGQFEQPGGRRVIDLDGCLPGTYELSLRSTESIATARVVLNADRTTVVETRWREVRKRVAVHGTVAVPDSWPISRIVELQAKGPDAPWPSNTPVSWTEQELDAGAGRVLTWSARSAFAGSAELQLGFGAFPMTTRIEVQVSPDATWHHELPDLATLVVRCTDRDSSEPLVQYDALEARLEGPLSFRPSSILRDRRTGEHSFWFPVGTAALRFHAPGWLPIERTVEVGEGTTFVSLDVPRAYSLTLNMEDREMPLAAYDPRGILDGLSLTRDGSPAEPAAWTLARGILLDLDHPGPWTVALAPLAGFEPIGPFEVTLRRDETTSVDVVLAPVRP